MSGEVRALVMRLHKAGWSCERISRCVSLPVYDVARVIL